MEEEDQLKALAADARRSLSTNHTIWARREGEWVKVSAKEFDAGTIKRPVGKATTCRATRAEQKAQREQFYAACRRQIAEADPSMSAQRLARLIGCSADFVVKTRAEQRSDTSG